MTGEKRSEKLITGARIEDMKTGVIEMKMTGINVATMANTKVGKKEKIIRKNIKSTTGIMMIISLIIY